jgi:hypothetical protein
MPTARLGVRHAPLVLPCWRDLDPEGSFMAGLLDKPIPSGVAHHLVYTYRREGDAARGRGNDGVVPLASQLPDAARAQAAGVHGFRSGHVEVLRDANALGHVASLIGSVKTPYPDGHLRFLDLGGFDVALGPGYGPYEVLAVRVYGHYLRALANHELRPTMPFEDHFVEVMDGRAAPQYPAEVAWLKFRSEHPELARFAPEVRPAEAGTP